MDKQPAEQSISSIMRRACVRFTQKELAEKLGVDVKTIGRWIREEAKPSPLMIPGIKQAIFGAPAQEPSKSDDFTFIDLFAGIGGIRLGFEAAGGKCVFTSEWNPYAQKTYMANFNDDHEINGDITKVDVADIPDHDVLVGGFPCFAKGTLVHAIQGLRPIESIRAGDMVLGSSGQYRRVGAAMQKPGAPTRTVSISACHGLITTDEHPFWARRASRGWSPSMPRQAGSLQAAQWTPAAELDIGCFVGFPVDAPMGFALQIAGKSRSEPAFWGIAGGWIKDGMPEGVLGEGMGLAALAQEMAAQGGSIPGYVFHLPQPHQRELAMSWLGQCAHALDGSMGAICVGSRPLALGLARLCRNAFGVSPALGPSSMGWELMFGSAKLGASFQEDGFIWSSVLGSAATGFRESVHNIAVDGDESYVVEGALVHNCQPFSIAGVSKKNSLGRKHGFEDKTQGTLFFDVARIIAAKRPKAFMLENVKNLLSHDKGQTFKVILETLEKDLGYKVQHRVIDGGRFTPQHRERILIVGFREDAGFDFSKLALPAAGPKLGSILHPQNGTEKLADSYIAGAKGRIEPKFTITDNLWAYLQAYAAKHKAAGNGFGFGLVGPGSTTRTLSARYYKDGSEILVDQGKRKNPRRLTPRECARLMGFPDSYQIPVSDSQSYKQFGNSVVVPVMAAVAAHMRPSIVKLVADQAAASGGKAQGKKGS